MQKLDNININVNLFAHIQLDAELQGRYGVQGNTFKNTVGYLNQYIQSIKTTDSQLNALVIGMQSLVHHETSIHDLDLEIKNETHLTALVTGITDQIVQLAKERDLLMPGGWCNANEDGHALIYQFKKTPHGLRLSIYNAGAGSETHEQWSSTKHELFYPVKIVELTNPIQHDKLQRLIKELVLPLLTKHPSRDKTGFDEIKLDRMFKRELALLDAKPIDVSTQLSQDMATAGQLSGTCSQRSVHQMLKVNFKKLADYQRFIFKFKMHALRDFIKTHQAPRARAIAELIQLAIENNLKLLQVPGVFTAEEQNIAADELILLKESIVAKDAIIAADPPQELLQKETEYKLTVRGMLLGSTQRSIPIQTKAPPVHPFNHASPNSTPELILLHHQTPLLDQLDRIIAQCSTMKDCDNLWVLKQIEHTLLELPLPNENIVYYQHINSPDANEQIIHHLDTLQTLYLDVYPTSCGNTNLPNLYLTHWSLLAYAIILKLNARCRKMAPLFIRT